MPNWIMQSGWTVRDILVKTASCFESHNIDSPRLTAEILLGHTLEMERVGLMVHHDRPLSIDEKKAFNALVERRLQREPVAYIVGVKEFWSMELAVTPDVLIPRPETECLVEAALAFLSAVPSPKTDSPLYVLELGTGSGAIILSLAKERPKNRYYALDRSIGALNIAKKNAVRHQLEPYVRFFAADWFQALSDRPPRFDMIISNPPYIRREEFDELQCEVKDFEPRLALDGGPGGLTDLTYIIQNAHRYLKPGGALFLETGHDQKAALIDRIKDTKKYDNVVFGSDYSGYDRWVHMVKR